MSVFVYLLTYRKPATAIYYSSCDSQVLILRFHQRYSDYEPLSRATDEHRADVPLLSADRSLRAVQGPAKHTLARAGCTCFMGGARSCVARQHCVSCASVLSWPCAVTTGLLSQSRVLSFTSIVAGPVHVFATVSLLGSATGIACTVSLMSSRLNISK